MKFFMFSPAKLCLGASANSPLHETFNFEQLATSILMRARRLRVILFTPEIRFIAEQWNLWIQSSRSKTLSIVTFKNVPRVCANKKSWTNILTFLIYPGKFRIDLMSDKKNIKSK